MAQSKKPRGAPQDSIRGGYERIAFGGVCDAVRLLFEEEPAPEVLAGLDLYNVEQIKRLKGGGMEITFYDRMKALECLRELSEKGEQDSPLYRALEACARAGAEDQNGV